MVRAGIFPEQAGVSGSGVIGCAGVGYGSEPCCHANVRNTFPALKNPLKSVEYVGRLAPTPTGYLHLGHALTFSTAHRRARDAGGRLILRIEDLDPQRCRREFVHAAIEDLRWIGLDWEGGPVFQSERREDYLRAWRKLRDGGFIYPCTRSRREISSLAPHAEEPVFPKEWRPAIDAASGL